MDSNRQDGYADASHVREADDILSDQFLAELFSTNTDPSAAQQHEPSLYLPASENAQEHADSATLHQTVIAAPFSVPAQQAQTPSIAYHAAAPLVVDYGSCHSTMKSVADWPNFAVDEPQLFQDATVQQQSSYNFIGLNARDGYESNVQITDRTQAPKPTAAECAHSEDAAGKHSGIMITPPTTHHSTHESAWDPSKILLKDLARHLASQLSLGKFEGKAPEELYDPFCRMLKEQLSLSSRMNTERITRSNSSPRVDPNMTDDRRQSVGKGTFSVESGSSAVSEADEMYDDGGTDALNTVDYTPTQAQTLKQYVISKRKTKCKRSGRKTKRTENDTSGFLMCLKPGCDAIFSRKGDWDRHTQQLIVKHAWLCPYCPDSGPGAHVELRRDRLKKHFLDHHISQGPHAEREAKDLAQRCKPYRPAFFAACGYCNNFATRERLEWLNHVHDHFDDVRDPRAVKAKWNECLDYPPPLPTDPAKTRKRGCANLDHSGVTPKRDKTDTESSASRPGPRNDPSQRLFTNMRSSANVGQNNKRSRTGRSQQSHRNHDRYERHAYEKNAPGVSTVQASKTDIGATKAMVLRAATNELGKTSTTEKRSFADAQLKEQLLIGMGEWARNAGAERNLSEYQLQPKEHMRLFEAVCA